MIKRNFLNSEQLKLTGIIILVLLEFNNTFNFYVNMKESENQNVVTEANQMIQRNRYLITLERLKSEKNLITNLNKMYKMQVGQIDANIQEIEYNLQALGFAEDEKQLIHSNGK